MLSRRGLLTGLGSIIAAPAVVPYGSLMPVRGIIQAFSLWMGDEQLNLRYDESTKTWTATIPVHVYKVAENAYRAVTIQDGDRGT